MCFHDLSKCPFSTRPLMHCVSHAEQRDHVGTSPAVLMLLEMEQFSG